jgi:hypothetical protein
VLATRVRAMNAFTARAPDAVWAPWPRMNNPMASCSVNGAPRSRHFDACLEGKRDVLHAVIPELNDHDLQCLLLCPMFIPHVCGTYCNIAQRPVGWGH